MQIDSNLFNGYQSAYDKASEILIGKNPEEISLNTSSIYNENTNCLQIHYLGSDYLVDCESGEVTHIIGDTPVKTTVKVLILHYMLHAKKRQPLSRLISFREVRGGGANYYPVFCKRAVLPLQKTFEKNIDKLIQAGIQLGGKSETYGDASITLPIFPLVPVTYIIWQADEEIPPSASILFDGNIISYLSCEDIVFAASFGTYELMNVARSLS